MSGQTTKIRLRLNNLLERHGLLDTACETNESARRGNPFGAVLIFIYQGKYGFGP
jgi:hypothetical protein